VKHTPIKPKHVGCGCCVPSGQILHKTKSLDVGFGFVTLIIKFHDGSSIYRGYIGGVEELEEKEPETVEDLEREYGDKLQEADCVTLFFNTPLHDETYEYNQEDGEWYLIAQGMGFA